jgi:hypothetical protein
MRNLDEILHGFIIPQQSYVLVCGCRDFLDQDLVWAVLDKVAPRFVVTGGQGKNRKNRGADLLAETWAKSHEYLPTHKVGLDVVHADWDAFGRSAGPRRNSEMLIRHPHIEWAIGFAGNRGTADMLEKARQLRVPAVHFESNGIYRVIRSFDIEN